jgi:hypothetical protein
VSRSSWPSSSSAFLTLGVCYQSIALRRRRISLFLRRVDRFSEKSLPVSLREREGYAARLLEIDARVKEVVAALQERGFQSPICAPWSSRASTRCASWKQKKGDTAPPMPIGAALTPHGRERQSSTRRLGARARAGAGRRGRVRGRGRE